MGIYGRISHWLHTMYPMGETERLPVVRDDYSTNIPGIYIVGDLAGVPLLKFSQHSGARVIGNILNNPVFERSADETLHDVVITGAGVAGISAAIECEKAGLRYLVLEASNALSTIENFPLKKPIYLYPNEMIPDGSLRISGEVRETLLDELLEQVRAHRLNVRPLSYATHVQKDAGALSVILENGESIRSQNIIIAIGRSGNFRRLNIPGEDLPKVSNRLHDPADFVGARVLVTGGGDSAAEAAIALAKAGANVTMVYRGAEFTRPKPENIQAVMQLASDQPAPGRIHLLLSTIPVQIREVEVELLSTATNQTSSLAYDAAFVLIGREAPLDFLRKSGITIHGEWKAGKLLGFLLFLLFCVVLFHWKAGETVTAAFQSRAWFPFNVGGLLDGLSATARDPASLLGTLRISMASPSFYYSFAYCAIVVVFGYRRIRRRKTPYVTAQTVTLALLQTIPLFLLPEIHLPYLGHNGAFDNGALKYIADHLFPEAAYGHGREYWRAVGFILAWPLFIYNVFTEQPLTWWLAISCIQTFVIIPGIIYFWGKGAYCGWICSCGALAETLGDTQRVKMPHGRLWSKLNMAGQVILWAAIALLLLRIAAWIWPESVLASVYNLLLYGNFGDNKSSPLNYKWLVDVTLAGIVGVGFYFWYSGRVWCRFFCPLAALMHIFAKFSRFRIIPEKKRCISCNVCTSVCHQGIDIMNFANKGIAMEDPQCVRCSACVQMCPTGVLQFGQVDRDGNVIRYDRLHASPVLMDEQKPTPPSD